MIWRIRWLLISVQAGGCGLQIGILRYFQCTKSFAGMLCSNTNDFKLFILLPPIFPLSRHGISYNGQMLFWWGVPFCENLIMQLSKVKTENDAHIMMTRSLRHGCFSVCVFLLILCFSLPLSLLLTSWFSVCIFLLILCFSLPLSLLLTSWLRELACQLHGGLFNPTSQLQNANPSTKTLRTAPLPRIYSPQKCMKSQHKGIERHITCCKTFNHVQAHQPYNCCYELFINNVN